MCLNCLRVASHKAKQCGAGMCRKCSKRHNTLLHLESSSKGETDPTPTTPNTPVTKEESVATTNVNHTTIILKSSQVLLSTAVVKVLNCKGQLVPCRAVLDNGSQSCLITSNYVNELGIEQFYTRIPICGVGAMSMRTRSVAKILVHSRVNGFQANLDCLVVDKITQNVPVNRVRTDDLQIPDGIILADPAFQQPAEINLLIGAKIFLDLLCIGRIKLSEDQPIWQKTLFGWIISGKLTGAPEQDYDLQHIH